MTRDVLLPSSGNIFIDSYQWNLIKKYLYDSFDFLYVFVNTPDLSDELFNEYKQLYNDPKVILLDPVNYYYGHITSMYNLIKNCKSDSICFFESDLFIFNSDQFNSSFKKIENGEINHAGCPRGFCDLESLNEFRRIYEKMEFRYENDNVWKWPSIEKWPGRELWYAFWPCEFYANRSVLNNIKYFEYPKCGPTDEIKELNNFICKHGMVYDTFGYAGLMLFYEKYKFDIISLVDFEEDSPYKIMTLGHFVNEEYLKKVKLKSIHICNSSALLNNAWMSGKDYCIEHLHINDANFLKNTAFTNAMFKIYSKKQSSYFKLMNGRFQEFLKLIQQNNNYVIEHAKIHDPSFSYLSTYDRIEIITNYYVNLLTEKL